MKKQTAVIALFLMVIVAGGCIPVWILAHANNGAKYDMGYQNGFSAGWEKGKNAG